MGEVRQGRGGVSRGGLASFFDGKKGKGIELPVVPVLGERERLPEVQRETAYLVYVEGLTYREAADTLAVPIGTVMSRLAAARARLAGMGSESKAEAEVARQESRERHGKSSR